MSKSQVYEDSLSWPKHPLTVSIVQNSAGGDPAANLAGIESLLTALPPGDLLALPELFAWRGREADCLAQAQALPGPIIDHLADLAVRRREWILAGSVIEKAGAAIFNTSVLLNRKGTIAASYRKIHLFEAKLETGQVIRESNSYSPGTAPALVDIEGWRCGLAICYDLRFPELFRYYAAAGAHLFLVPANFTQQTGRSHWEVLLRARAIENQVFVAAPNQCGVNPSTLIASYGHSLVIGPWGELLSLAGNEPQVLQATLDPAYLARIRASLPVLSQRRL